MVINYFKLFLIIIIINEKLFVTLTRWLCHLISHKLETIQRIDRLIVYKSEILRTIYKRVIKM